MSTQTLSMPLDSELAALDTTQLNIMKDAGNEVKECLRVLKKAELNVVGECLRNQGTFYEFDHYPQGDVYDDETHAQYYYHAHRGCAGEHGHFHTFLRAKGIPLGIQPAMYDGDEPWPEGDEMLSHIVAISMDRYGFPIGMFTTNRWVTGENWYAATDVIQMLDHFVVDHAYPSWPVNRWLSSMVVLFRPTIEALLRERDAVLRAWQLKHPKRDVFEDRELEIMTDARIAIDEQIDAINAVLSARAS